MKKELELKLQEEFPFMRTGNPNAYCKFETHADYMKWLKEENADAYDDRYTVYETWGCEMGDGWYEVIRGLCSDITTAYEKAGLPVDIIVRQVKEKFGCLRFYYSIKGQKNVALTIDKFDGPSSRKMPGDSDFHNEIAEIVRKWENKASTVCISCGADGELRKDISYILTLCDSCYAPIKKNEEEKKNKKKEEANQWSEYDADSHTVTVDLVKIANECDPQKADEIRREIRGKFFMLKKAYGKDLKLEIIKRPIKEVKDKENLLNLIVNTQAESLLEEDFKNK